MSWSRSPTSDGASGAEPSSRRTPRVRRISASAPRPVSDTACIASTACCGLVDTWAVAPSESATITVRWCATGVVHVAGDAGPFRLRRDARLLVALTLQPLGAFAQLDQQLTAGPDVEAQHRHGRHHGHQRGPGG